MDSPPVSGSQFAPWNPKIAEIEAYQAKLHEAVKCLSIGKKQWSNERWVQLALNVTQDYLDSVFEHRDEVAKLFRLVPDHSYLDGYYQALTRERPKDVNRVKEKLNDRFMNVGKSRKDPCYFTVVNDYLAFALPVWDLKNIPSVTEHIRRIAETQGIVYVRGKGLWGQCGDHEDGLWGDIASEQCVDEDDASWEDVASEPRIDEMDGSDTSWEQPLSEEEKPWEEIIQFIHVYIPKYGLIEFRILHPLAHCLFERDSELRNIYHPEAKKKEERARIWELYQVSKEFLLAKANNTFADELQKRQLQQKVIEKAQKVYTDERGIFRPDMEMRFILNVILEWPAELQTMSRKNHIQV